jgi:hypothetical protein
MALTDETEKVVDRKNTEIAMALQQAMDITLGGRIQRFLSEWQKAAPSMDDTNWDKLVDGWVKKGWVDESTKSMLYDVKKQPYLFRAACHLVLPLMLWITDFKQVVEITSMSEQYKRLAKAAPNPAPVDNLVRSMMLDPGRSTENRAELKKYGYSELQIDNIILSYYRLYDENTVKTAYLRGIITEEGMYERMRELGYTDTRTKEIVATWAQLPSPQDLFTMVAHEAFEKDMYTKLGLSAEFPTDQLPYLEQQGISPEWAMRYWISHWAEPSISQGYEMLHRGIIDLDTLDMLFRAVEIPSFWRDKLIKIAYQPLTRVDVRRMHQLGVLNNEQLIKSYLNIGYNADDALAMSNFTIKYNQSHTIELTRGAILDSYSEGLIKRDDAKKLLKEQDYNETTAEYYLTFEDYKRDKEIQKIYLGVLKDKFLMGLINEKTVTDELNKAGLLGKKIDALMEDWKLDQYKYENIPSKADLDRFLVRGFINKAEYEDLMKRHGFPMRFILLYEQDLQEDIESAGKSPTKADLDRWVKTDMITIDQYKSELKLLGYAQKYIDLYAKEK